MPLRFHRSHYCCCCHVIFQRLSWQGPFTLTCSQKSVHTHNPFVVGLYPLDPGRLSPPSMGYRTATHTSGFSAKASNCRCNLTKTLFILDHAFQETLSNIPSLSGYTNSEEHVLLLKADSLVWQLVPDTILEMIHSNLHIYSSTRIKPMMRSDPIQHYYDIGDTQTKKQSNSRRSMSAWIVLNGMQTKKELGRYSTELSRADKNKSKSMIEY